MRVVTGKPISPGYAQGYALIVGAEQVELPIRLITPDDVSQEIVRFHRALEQTAGELQRLQNRIQTEIGHAHAEIVSAHLLFLRDRKIIDGVEGRIREDCLGVESAIEATIAELARTLSEADNAYLRERADDIRDVGRRLIRQVFRFQAGRLARLPPDTILVARELLPSDVLELDRKHVLGMVTELGGETGHASILARAMGVPAVTGIRDAARIAKAGGLILLDGQAGEVVFDPTPERISSASENKAQYERFMHWARTAEARECVTSDGVNIKLFANIGRPHELQDVASCCLDGVGLFRTEYLFLDEPVPPSLERQCEVYQGLAEALVNNPLVIRTFDLGGDKRPAFLEPQFELNPNLGIRGLRFSLFVAEELFRIQVRALLSVSRHHNVWIMLPMVLGGDDLRQAIAIIREVADQEGMHELPAIGVLVETPAAVFAIEHILDVADFISIGTNDLTQFILAADRNALSMIGDYTVLHPSVLRAVQQVITAASTSGTPVAVCGEAAGDPRIACLLVGLGARSLSMSPICAGPVRYALRATGLQMLQELADAALMSNSAKITLAMLNERLKKVLPEQIATWPAL